MIGMQTENVLKPRAIGFAVRQTQSPGHNPSSEYSVAALKRRRRVTREVLMTHG